VSNSAFEGAHRVAVVGLGLIGGSIARDLAARGVWVLGYDRDANALESAVAAGVVQEVLDGRSPGKPAEIVVLAVPVTSAAAVMVRFASLCREARLITDVGSTKTAVQALAVREGLSQRFVGSHPLTGDHRSGWSASRVGRFDGARVFLCPAPGANVDAVALAHQLWLSLGARPEEIAATAHVKPPAAVRVLCAGGRPVRSRDSTSGAWARGP
jgi:prephenate dehydrogenase